MRGKITYFLLILPIVIFIVLFIFYPYTIIVTRAFKDNYTGYFTLRNLRNVFLMPAFRTAILNSLWFSLLTTVVAGFFGSLVGWVSTKMSDKSRAVLMSIFSIPMTLSGLVVAFSFIVLLGRNGIFNIIFRSLGFPTFNLYTWTGLVVAYCFFNIPLFSLTMIGAFKNLDIAVVEAARNLGANLIQTWLYVIIPVLLPAFLAAFSIVFAGMMGAFGTVLALTGLSRSLLSLQIYSHVSESYYNIPQANAFALVLGCLTSTILVTVNFIERKLRVKS